jgi:hypothetical protein
VDECVGRRGRADRVPVVDRWPVDDNPARHQRSRDTPAHTGKYRAPDRTGGLPSVPTRVRCRRQISRSASIAAP